MSQNKWTPCTIKGIEFLLETQIHWENIYKIISFYLAKDGSPYSVDLWEESENLGSLGSLF